MTQKATPFQRKQKRYILICNKKAVKRSPPLSGGDRLQSKGRRCFREVIDRSQKVAAVVGRRLIAVRRLPLLSGGDRSQSEGSRSCREVVDRNQQVPDGLREIKQEKTIKE